jgi:hypothetical protein
MARFVVLEHDYPELHWDFMLEVGSALHTWRLAQPPQSPGKAIETVRLADHRLEYLDYEGPVSGDRGTVRRWDRGSFEVLVNRAGEALRVRIVGENVCGVGILDLSEARWKFILEAEN